MCSVSMKAAFFWVASRHDLSYDPTIFTGFQITIEQYNNLTVYRVLFLGVPVTGNPFLIIDFDY
jgi:hypothetical protein